MNKEITSIDINGSTFAIGGVVCLSTDANNTEYTILRFYTQGIGGHQITYAVLTRTTESVDRPAGEMHVDARYLQSLTDNVEFAPAGAARSATGGSRPEAKSNQSDEEIYGFQPSDSPLVKHIRRSFHHRTGVVLTWSPIRIHTALAKLYDNILPEVKFEAEVARKTADILNFSSKKD